MALDGADSAGKLADVGLNLAADLVLHQPQVFFVVGQLELAKGVDR